MPAEDIERTIGLQSGIMKDETPASAKVPPLTHFDHTAAQGILVRAPAFAKYIAKYIHRSPGGTCQRHKLKGFGNIVPPDTHVHVCPFALDRIIPDVGYRIPIYIRIPVGTALVAEIGPPADGVVIPMIFSGIDIVKPYHIAAAAVMQTDRLRTRRMTRVPVIGGAPWVVNQVALNGEIPHIPIRPDCAVHISRISIGNRTTDPAPEGDITVFDDDIMPVLPDTDGIQRGILQPRPRILRNPHRFQ